LILTFLISLKQSFKPIHSDIHKLYIQGNASLSLFTLFDLPYLALPRRALSQTGSNKENGGDHPTFGFEVTVP
jgi:hypothetical protein